MHESSIIPSQRPLWQQTGERNNGFRKPFSFQTVSKYYQRYLWQWWRNPTWSCLFQRNHLAPAHVSAATTRNFSREHWGRSLWSFYKAEPFEMSSLAAVLTAGAAPCEPAPSAAPRMAAATLSGPCRAACLALLGCVRLRTEHLSLSPAAKKKIYFWAMRGLQPSFRSATIPFYTGVTAGLSYCALCGVDVIRTRL